MEATNYEYTKEELLRYNINYLRILLIYNIFFHQLV